MKTAVFTFPNRSSSGRNKHHDSEVAVSLNLLCGVGSGLCVTRASPCLHVSQVMWFVSVFITEDVLHVLEVRPLSLTLCIGRVGPETSGVRAPHRGAGPGHLAWSRPVLGPPVAGLRPQEATPAAQMKAEAGGREADTRCPPNLPSTPAACGRVSWGAEGPRSSLVSQEGRT